MTLSKTQKQILCDTFFRHTAEFRAKTTEIIRLNNRLAAEMSAMETLWEQLEKESQEIQTVVESGHAFPGQDRFAIAFQSLEQDMKALNKSLECHNQRLHQTASSSISPSPN